MFFFSDEVPIILQGILISDFFFSLILKKKMSGYLPVDSTYTSTVIDSNATLSSQMATFMSPYQRIVPQGEYQVSIHPSPFQYYSLQHGKEPSNAYFNIMSAYNGICSTSAYRECSGTTIQETLPPTK
jgi:hypothetical protein